MLKNLKILKKIEIDILAYKFDPVEILAQMEAVDGEDRDQDEHMHLHEELFGHFSPGVKEPSLACDALILDEIPVIDTNNEINVDEEPKQRIKSTKNVKKEKISTFQFYSFMKK